MPKERLDPNHIFRECDAKSIFGYSPSTLREKIQSGAIPKPVLLSPPPSRARGWWGWQINEWQDRIEQQQEAWAAAHTDVKGEGSLRYVPKGGDLRNPATATEAKLKVAKVKGLKRPVRLQRRSAKG